MFLNYKETESVERTTNYHECADSQGNLSVDYTKFEKTTKTSSSRGFNFFKVVFTFTFLPFTLYPVPLESLDYLNSDSHILSLESTIYSGTGGPNVFKFVDNFIKTDANYICDENIYGISYEGGSTKVQYSIDVELGQIFEFYFRPLGSYASNVVFYRPDLYEIVLGDNDFSHISLKNLNSESFIDLNINNSVESLGKKRVKLYTDLSTTTHNTVIIEEIMKSESEMYLVIIVNEHKLYSEKFSIENKNKHKSIGFALLDLDSKDRNYTRVDFYDVRVCK